MLKLFLSFLLILAVKSCAIVREKRGPISVGDKFNINCGDKGNLTIGESQFGQTVKSCEKMCKLETRCKWFEYEKRPNGRCTLKKEGCEQVADGGGGVLFELVEKAMNCDGKKMAVEKRY